MPMLRTFAALTFLALLAACVGSTSGGVVTANGPFTIVEAGNARPQASPLVLLDQQFLDPLGDSDLLTTLPAAYPDTQWSSSGGSAALTTQQPFTTGIGGGAVPTAPPGAIYVYGTASHGRSIVTATEGGRSATYTVLHYGSLALGCQFRYQPAINFDLDRPLSTATFMSADIYVTAPATQLSPLDACYNTALANGSSVLWHVPNGATFIQVSSMRDFIAITPALWKNDGTVFAPPSSTTAILLKTAEGHFAKAIVPVGAFDVTSTSSFLVP